MLGSFPMANLQIKNIPEDIHAELRRRAQLEDTTVRDYVLGLLRHDQRLPARADWLARLDALDPVELDRPAHEALADERTERDRELVDRTRLGGSARDPGVTGA